MGQTNRFLSSVTPPPFRCHYRRRAAIGSTCVARRAGTYDAASATSANVTDAAAKVAGSYGETPDNRLDVRRVNVEASRSPMAVPAAIHARQMAADTFHKALCYHK